MTELRCKAAIVALLAIVDASWIVFGGYTFDIRSLGLCLSMTALMASVGYVYTKLRTDERLGVAATETAFLLIFSALACVLSYLVTGLGLPLIDNALAATDKSLGFNWLNYVAFADSHPWIGMLTTAVYRSTLYQIALTVVVLPLFGHADRAREMTLTVMMSALLCIVISGVLPAAGALAYFHPGAGLFLQHHPVVDLSYKQVFFDMRSGALRHLSLIDVHGLIAFPSYHVALSVILMVAFRGVKLWFWPIAVLNLLVILATPIEGGHHLSDALGGAALALFSATVVVALRKRFTVPAPQPEPAILVQA